MMSAATVPRIYVDVALGDGMDGGVLVRSILEGMGATVYKTWPGASSRATHVVWKAGDARVLEEARQCGASVVGLSWVNACQDADGWAPAAAHAIAVDRSRAREYP